MVVCFLIILPLSTLADAVFSGHSPLYSWTWDVLNLIRDAEEADGDV